MLSIDRRPYTGHDRTHPRLKQIKALWPNHRVRLCSEKLDVEHWPRPMDIYCGLCSAPYVDTYRFTVVDNKFCMRGGRQLTINDVAVVYGCTDCAEWFA